MVMLYKSEITRLLDRVTTSKCVFMSLCDVFVVCFAGLTDNLCTLACYEKNTFLSINLIVSPFSTGIDVNGK